MSVEAILAQMGQNARARIAGRGSMIADAVGGLASIPGQIMDERAQRAIQQQQLQRQQMQDARLSARDDRQAFEDQRGDAALALDARTKAATNEILMVYHGGTPNDPTTNNLPGAKQKALELGMPQLVKQLEDLDYGEQQRAQPKLTEFDPSKGLQDQSGKVIREPVRPPERPVSPTEASLAVQAASGDPQAVRALALIRAQHPKTPAQPRDEGQPVSVMMPDATGKMVPTLVRRSEAYGKTPGSAGAGGGKGATGAQNKTLGFFNRAKQAADDLDSVETAIAEKGLIGQAWMSTMHNAVQTQEAQTYQQAQRAFTEARLRKDSGAAIPAEEFESDRKTYFVQPGDSKETLAQKKRARSAMLASLGFEAGPALQGFYGDDADGMVQGYRAAAAPRAAATPGGTPSAGGGGEGTVKPIPGHPGMEQTLKNGVWVRTK